MKTGDRVRLTKVPPGCEAFPEFVGRVGTVIGVDPDPDDEVPFKVNLDDSQWDYYWCESDGIEGL